MNSKAEIIEDVLETLCNALKEAESHGQKVEIADRILRFLDASYEMMIVEERYNEKYFRFYRKPTWKEI